MSFYPLKRFIAIAVLGGSASLILTGSPDGRAAAAQGSPAAALFEKHCANCHGADGRGAVELPDLPNLADPAFHRGRTDARLIATITNGRGIMPSFRGDLKPAEIRLLVQYVRSLSPRPSARPGAGAGQGLLERALSGQARIIDLTQPISRKTPTFSGQPDQFRYEQLAEMGRDGYSAGAIRVPEHFGTHVDAPGHFLKGRETVERIEVKRLLAPAVVIDVRARVGENPDYRLEAADIRRWEGSGAIPEGAAVLLLTGWDKRFGSEAGYRNAGSDGVMHFPGYSEDAIKYLVETRRVVALGIDTLSIDYGPSKDFAGHKLSHASGLYHIENMTNLDKLPPRGAVIFVGPLPIEGGSGSPARVLAIAP